MARLRASWRTSLPVVQQPRNPQSESIARSPYEAALLVKGHVAHPARLRAIQVLAAGKTAIRRRLTRRRAVRADVALQHRHEPVTVGRVAGLDHQIEDQAAPAGGQGELVTVLDVAAALDDDVGMALEQADQLVAGGHRLAAEHPPLALCDHPLDQGLIVADLGPLVRPAGWIVPWRRSPPA